MERYDEKKEFLKAACFAAGVDCVGVCDLSLVKEKFSKLPKVKDLAFSKGLWQDKIDYKKLMPTAKSVVAFLVSHNVEVSVGEPSQTQGKLARVALGEDYHRVLKAMGEQVLSFMRERFKTEGLVLVDMNPLLERLFAHCAGVGEIGENGFLINPDFGSFVSIGLILLDCFLEPDTLVEGVCLHCNKCLLACPSGALGKNSFCAKKCIAYRNQNILSGEYPSIYLYGCDECQNSCPVNIQAKKATAREFLKGACSDIVELEEIVSMSNSQIKKRFEGSSMLWRGEGLLRRNAKFILLKKKTHLWE